MTQAEQQTGQRCVLIADDDPVFQETARAMLVQAGIEVIAAEDGLEAMETLLRERVDLAIIDLVMPRIDGLRLIGLIRATPGLRRLPILVITSNCDPSIQAEGIQVGANDCMTKPVDWAFLPQRIKQMIEAAAASK